MTTQPQGGNIPEWTLGDRLRKARELTGLDLQTFAHEIGVDRKTAASAEQGRRDVRGITIRAYAFRTGVPVAWLETGIAPSGGDGSGGHARTNVLPLRLRPLAA